MSETPTPSPQSSEPLSLSARVNTKRPPQTYVGGEKVSPRVDKMENPEIQSVGGARLEQPDKRAIEAITTENPKIQYFPTPDIVAFQASDTNHFAEPEYSRFITEPLIRALAERFSGKTLALRGIKTSVNGTLGCTRIIKYSKK